MNMYSVLQVHGKKTVTAAKIPTRYFGNNSTFYNIQVLFGEASLQ